MIQINRGDAASIPVEITYDSDGTAYNLTGKTVFFTVKRWEDKRSDDNEAVISKNITSHSAPASGQTTIELLASDTDISPGTYKYDIQVEGADGKPISTITDKFIVYDDVTKRRYSV